MDITWWYWLSHVRLSIPNISSLCCKTWLFIFSLQSWIRWFFARKENLRDKWGPARGHTARITVVLLLRSKYLTEFHTGITAPVATTVSATLYDTAYILLYCCFFFLTIYCEPEFLCWIYSTSTMKIVGLDCLLLQLPCLYHEVKCYLLISPT